MRIARSLIAIVGAGVLLVRCASPTSIRVAVYSEVNCADGSEAALVGGKTLGELSAKAPASTSTECAASAGTNALGDVVLTPEDGSSDEVAFQLMVRTDKEPAETCRDPANAAKCIVSRRQIRFSPRDELRMRVDLRLSCLGVVCPDDQTCVRGKCLSARIPTAACVNDACDESVLGVVDPIIDAGVDGDAATAIVPSAVAAGFAHACALTNQGGVRCWGQLFGPRPVEITGFAGSVKAIAAGGNHSCAILAEGDRVQCWGKNESGQLGNQSKVDSLANPVDVAGLTASSLSLGNNHSCAVTSDGTVHCWGWNSSGQLGSGTEDSTVPLAVVLEGPSKAVAAGGNHTCAILTSGAVRCWGSNSNGQLGNPSAPPQSTSPIAVGDVPSDVTEIAAGWFHNCAMAAGRVFCWGMNSYGQLGNGDRIDQDAPVSVLGMNDAVAIDIGGGASADFTCARTSAGPTRCWGYNGGGRIGYPTDTIYSLTPGEVQNVSNVAAIALGDAFGCALVNGGVIKCWGSNTYGQRGSGSTNTSEQPTDVLWP